MGRLIDSNDLRKAMTWDNDLTKDDVQFILDKCPTAYKIDKVVQQIKDVIVNSFDCERLCKHRPSECNDCQEYGYDEEILRQKIIEIVKKGGIE